MKEKILIFVIGILLGAVIATGTFYVYNKTIVNNNCNTNNVQPPEMPNGQVGEPPEMPNNNTQNN